MNQHAASEFASAMKPVGTAKCIFLLLILVCLVVQTAGFVLLEFTALMDAPSAAAEGEKSVSTPPAETMPAASKEQPRALRDAFHWILPITKFLALACGVLVVISLMFLAALSLLGQGQGSRRLLSAFCWSLILLVMVIPWQRVFQSSLACGALYNLGELTKWYDSIHTGQGDLMKKIFYFARFLGYPGLTLLVWIVVLVKSGGGYSRLVSGEVAKSPPLSAQ